MKMDFPDYYKRIERLNHHFQRICNSNQKKVMVNEDEKQCTSRTFDYVNPILFNKNDDLIASTGSISVSLNSVEEKVSLSGELPVYESDVYRKVYDEDEYDIIFGTHIELDHPYKYKELHDNIPNDSDAREVTRLINGIEGCKVKEFHLHRHSIHVHFECDAPEDQLDMLTRQYRNVVEAINISLADY